MAKVIFLHLSVILFTGGVCLSACWDATTPPGPGRHPPPRTRQTPPPGPGRHPPQTRQTPPSPGSRLQNMVYEWPVRILLECILVRKSIWQICSEKKKLQHLDELATVRKWSLGQGNVFTPVCQPFCSQGGWTPLGRHLSEQTPYWADMSHADTHPGHTHPQVDTPETATEAGGTHPTGMYSCWNLLLLKKRQ